MIRFSFFGTKILEKGPRESGALFFQLFRPSSYPCVPQNPLNSRSSWLRKMSKHMQPSGTKPDNFETETYRVTSGPD